MRVPAGRPYDPGVAQDTVTRTATPDDAAALVELFTAVERADDTGEHHNLEDVLEAMKNPIVDPSRDWFLVERDGRLVAATTLQARAPAGGAIRVHLGGGVHPDHRRQGIGGALLETARARAAAYVAERGSDLRTVLAVDARVDATGLVTMLERAGFTPEYWSFAMTARLPRQGGPAVVPDGLVLETWEGVDDEEMRAAHNRAFAGHRGWSPWDAEMWRTWITSSRHHRPALSLLLRDERGAIAAYVHATEFDAEEQATGVREAYLSKVGTAPEHRRRGLASVLLRLVLDRAAEQGYDVAALDVDAHNATGALSVYEQAGFEVTRRWVTYAVELPPASS